MKYSIVIPTLNEEKLLPDLLKQLTDPVLRNDFDLEIIISDGGSRDNTIKIALDYADIVTVYTNDKIQNIAAGRNEGAKKASGDILFFLNGDIRIDEPLKFFNFIRNNFEISGYLAMTVFVSIFPEESNKTDKIFHFCYNHYFRWLNNIGIGMGRGECQIVRKNIFEEIKGYNENLAAGEDFELFHRIRKKGDILYTDKIRVFESPRRFRLRGYFTITWIWTKNSFYILLKNKSISKIWEQVR